MLYEQKTNMRPWFEIKQEFDTDGSLRDIYIENIEPSTWNLFIQKIKQSDYRFEFNHGDSSAVFPDSIDSIKELQKVNPTILRLWLNDSIQLNCHFFIETEIELDVSPYDIQNEESYIELINFLNWLAFILDTEVKLTHEGMQDQLILKIQK